MEFNSLFFLFVFLPVFTGLMYFCKKDSVRNIITLLFSVLFYAFGDRDHLLLLFLTCLIAYFSARNVRKNRTVYLLYLIVTVLILCLYKYGNYVRTAFSSYFADPDFGKILMPLGISFYTFTSIAYVTDVYRGKYEAEKDLFHLCLFLTFFPVVISGPILRYPAFRDQLSGRKIDTDSLAQGLRRFLTGLGKKVLIANQLSLVSNTLFSDTLQASFPLAVYALAAYALQLYYDFSGYSDMAIGIARMIGFTIPENFNDPYLSHSIEEFWRRWHISLSNWLRDYIYIPLGGNRKGLSRKCLNVLIVFLVSGLWHGSTWFFLIWGLYHGLLRVSSILFADLYRKVKTALHIDDTQKWYRAFQILRTDILIMISYIPFRSQTLLQAKILTKGILGRGFRFDAFYTRQLDVLYLLFYVLLGVLFLFPSVRKIFQKIEEKSPYVYDVLLLLLTALSVFYIVSGSYSAFIYFDF